MGKNPNQSATSKGPQDSLSIRFESFDFVDLSDVRNESSDNLPAPVSYGRNQLEVLLMTAAQRTLGPGAPTILFLKSASMSSDGLLSHNCASDVQDVRQAIRFEVLLVWLGLNLFTELLDCI